MTRGKLILIEGLDRTGKTTQSEILADRLKPQSKLLKFPDRATPIGKLIDQYLTDKDFALPDQAAHLLFSANRWEVAETIKNLLLQGTNVILDRYVYSGVAYSAAKKVSSMDIDWCLQPDKGLLKPDVTLFLTNEDQKENEARKGFGSERYEVGDFQLKVKDTFLEVFKRLENYPETSKDRIIIIDVSGKSIEQVSDQIWGLTKDIVEKQLTNEFEYF